MPSPVSLDELATAWLSRRITDWAAMPGLNHDLGSLQLEADPVAFKHPVFPPYSAANEISGLTLLGGRQVAQYGVPVELRWRAWMVERRFAADGWRLASQTVLLPGAPGVLVVLDVHHEGATPRELDLGLVLSGRSRNTGPEGYNWSVPSIPTDMFSFRQDAGLVQTVSAAATPGGRCFANDCGNGHSVQVAWPPPDAWPHPRLARWRRTLAPGDTWRVCLVASFCPDRGDAEALAARWVGRETEALAGARAWWEARWAAAFAGGGAFSGALPVLESDSPALRRLYYMGVLTLLTLRRDYPHSLVRPCYLTLWPRRGEGSVYLQWELPFTSGLLARLDPAVLRALYLTLVSAPAVQGQMTNYFTGHHWGWGCCSAPHALLAAGLNLARWPGDLGWRHASVRRRPEGRPAAAQPAPDDAPGAWRTLTGDEAFQEMLMVHRERHLPESALVDYGPRHAYHECLTTYAHGTAAHTAVQAWALREADALCATDHRAEAERLEAAVRAAYLAGRGHFTCTHPDGRTHPAANLYDLGIVLNTIGERLPPAMVAEIEGFARRELLTPTWAHCLSPADPDVVDGQRGDHGWVGCFGAWPPLFVMGLLRAGRAAPWLAEYLEGMSRLALQGPFGQGYWAEDLHAPEHGAAAKGHDHLDCLMHWVIGSGAYFAEMVLDGVLGLHATADGRLTVRPGLEPWARTASLTGIRHRGRLWDLRDGVLRPA